LISFLIYEGWRRCGFGKTLITIVYIEIATHSVQSRGKFEYLTGSWWF